MGDKDGKSREIVITDFGKDTDSGYESVPLVEKKKVPILSTLFQTSSGGAKRKKHTDGSFCCCRRPRK